MRYVLLTEIQRNAHCILRALCICVHAHMENLLREELKAISLRKRNFSVMNSVKNGI